MLDISNRLYQYALAIEHAQTKATIPLEWSADKLKQEEGIQEQRP